MLDNLNHHTNRDVRAELTDVQRELDAAVRLNGHYGSWEDQYNNQARVDNLAHQAFILTIEATQQDEELQRLADAVTATGAPHLATLAYIAYGPAALPSLITRYEVRLIERRGGYTVPGGVRRNLTSDQVTETQRELLTWVMRHNGHAALWGHSVRDYRILTTAY